MGVGSTLSPEQSEKSQGLDAQTERWGSSRCPATPEARSKSTNMDCLVDVGEGNYKEIQIKSREDDAIFTPQMFKLRSNFFLTCSVNSKRGDHLWGVSFRGVP